MVTPPANPAGPLEAVDTYDEAVKARLVDGIRVAPQRLKEAVTGLAAPQLDTLYKNWTVRQIVHHIADSHLHSYIRFKWALTEQTPTIKPYDEAAWVMLEDCQRGDIQPSVSLLDALHARWVELLDGLGQEQLERTFFHPETGRNVSLWEVLNYYPWHSRHHTGQILWLREQHGW